MDLLLDHRRDRRYVRLTELREVIARDAVREEFPRETLAGSQMGEQSHRKLCNRVQSLTGVCSLKIIDVGQHSSIRFDSNSIPYNYSLTIFGNNGTAFDNFTAVEMRRHQLLCKQQCCCLYYISNFILAIN